MFNYCFYSTVGYQTSACFRISERICENRLLGLIPRDSDSVDRKWSTTVCLSNMFPDAADAAGLETTL